MVKDKFDGDANDASIIELSGTYDAGPEITAFYRTDGSMGVYLKSVSGKPLVWSKKTSCLDRRSFYGYYYIAPLIYEHR